jgi:hypothetical protein
MHTKNRRESYFTTRQDEAGGGVRERGMCGVTSGKHHMLITRRTLSIKEHVYASSIARGSTLSFTNFEHAYTPQSDLAIGHGLRAPAHGSKMSTSVRFVNKRLLTCLPLVVDSVI